MTDIVCHVMPFQLHFPDLVATAGQTEDTADARWILDGRLL